jgi:hypothetical protein
MIILKKNLKKRHKKITFQNKIMKMSPAVSQGLSKLQLPYNFNLRYNNILGKSSQDFSLIHQSN